MIPKTRRELLSTREVEAITGWGLPKIRQLIRSGFLTAINTSPGKRPTYHITRQELDRVLTAGQPKEPEPIRFKGFRLPLDDSTKKPH